MVYQDVVPVRPGMSTTRPTVRVVPDVRYPLTWSGQAKMPEQERGPGRIHRGLVLVVQLQRMGSVTHEVQGLDGSAHVTGPLFGVRHAGEEHHCVVLRRNEVDGRISQIKRLEISVASRRRQA